MSRKKITPEQKMAILKEIWTKKASVADVCKKHDLPPSQVYQWQKQVFDNAKRAFSPKSPSLLEHKQSKKLAEENQRLEAKLRQREGALAELVEEHVNLKKKIAGVD